MHELSVTEEIVAQAAAEVERRGWKGRVRFVHLRLGALTTFVPQSLVFYFDILKKDTCLKDATLLVEEVAVRGKCGACGAVVAFEELPFLCPACGCPEVEITQGRELELTSFTVDEETHGDKSSQTGDG